MKARFVAVMATALVSGVSSPIASANQLPGAMVTGHITSVSGTEWINVDGHSYRIASSSAAASAVSKLTPGQLVDVQLTGPANSSASEVVNVVLHSGQ
jgi:hypothetical protein